jgi:hypothetical protein
VAAGGAEDGHLAAQSRSASCPPRFRKERLKIGGEEEFIVTVHAENQVNEALSAGVAIARRRGRRRVTSIELQRRHLGARKDIWRFAQFLPSLRVRINQTLPVAGP